MPKRTAPARRLALTALALAAGCGQDSTGPDTSGARRLALGPDRFRLSAGAEVILRTALYDADDHLIASPPLSAFTWVSDAPGVATVTPEGVISVQPGAGVGLRAVIHALIDSLDASVEVEVAPATVAVHIVPGPVTLTPGGELLLFGVAEGPGGGRASRHYFRFELSTGSAVSLHQTGCTLDDCVAAAPDLAILRGVTPGKATVVATADGETTTEEFTVRHVSFTSVTAGGSHTCGTASDGVLFCWGDGLARTPVGVRVVNGLHSIQAGVTRTCALDQSGLARCWFNRPQPNIFSLSQSIHFSQLALGPASSCGVDTQGSAWCWGINDRGQLGDGSRQSSETPVPVAGGLQFTQVSTYGDHACGLAATGAAYCWGLNGSGQLGTTEVTGGCGPDQCALVPVPVIGGHAFTRIAAGSRHTCALDGEGAAWCWGAAARVGRPDVTSGFTAEPLAVAGDLRFEALTAGADHTCGLTSAGEGYCWGANPDGRTGQSPGAQPTDPVTVPTAIAGGRRFTAIDAGGGHTCGLTDEGLYCWGDNGTGQAGVTEGYSGTPARVVGQP